MASLEEIVQLAKKRGFVFPSSEIYDGCAGIYDYGPLGVELANNIKQQWWSSMVRKRQDIVGLDAGIVMHPSVWEASGHTTGFTDPVVVCKKTGKRYRADHLLEDAGVAADERMSQEEFCAIFEQHKEKIQVCDPDDLGTPTFQNLLVSAGIGEGEVYLRGETCQGIYVNFKQVLDSMHMKLPFGIAQIGKAFRNEISPRQFLFRTREFEQMEMQYFCHEDTSSEHFAAFLASRQEALVALGLRKENLRVTEHKNLVFYASAASDIEYHYPFGWKELEGVHDRGTYDLTQHALHAKERLTYFDQDRNEHIVPAVVETSIGVGRLFLALLADAYAVETLDDGTERTVLRFKPSIAPMQVAVLPLFRREGQQRIAHRIVEDLAKHVSAYYDDTGAVGKRYRRADEIGTPFAVTVDHETEENETVTVRDRDSMKQDRVAIEDLASYVNERIN
ncbi:MAG: glycine--tRNA ligase [Candidatus Kaiserbacteria bacterium]|nr:glycine--tRNA ligase [Candidatus Kaiserbacteria bacterium]